MEQERPEGIGKLIISVHESIPRGKFSLAIKVDSKLVTMCTGSFVDLTDSFVANGEGRSLALRGIDIYFLYNPLDLKDEELRRYILPPGMNINY